MWMRKLGSVLRGDATPFQIVAACTLGALLGFAPGAAAAPALWILLAAALLLVNANLGLALLVAAGAKLVALLAVPLSFRVGRFLLDGPTEGIARALVNAPVLAWCGLDRYAVAGGQAVGLVLGATTGLLVTRTATAFRRRMAARAADPDRAAKPPKRGAGLLLWLLFGGKGKKSWDEKTARRIGNPVRVAGAVVLVLMVAGAWAANEALAGPLARRGLQTGLEGFNGATVDVGGVDLALGDGRLSVSGLALADANDLGRDLFRAEHLEADFDRADLLRRQVHVARVVVSEAESGAPRATPAEHVGAPPEPAAEERAGAGAPEAGDLSLEDVLQEYETWKERLAQARRWLDRLSGPPEAEAEGGEEAESLSERLAREVRERGWFGVHADLREDAPTLRLSELVVEGLEAAWLPGRVLDLRGEELSTDPGLVDAPPRLSLASRDGAILFEVDLAPASRGGGEGGLRFHWKGLAVDDVLARLKLPGSPPLRGGTLDLELAGPWSGGRIGELALPLRATIRDTRVAVAGREEPVELLELPIELAGRLDAPRIRFDGKTFTDALAEAGKSRLANELRGQLGEETQEALDELREKTGLDLPAEVPKDAEGLADEAKKLLGGLRKKKDG